MPDSAIDRIDDAEFQRALAVIRDIDNETADPIIGRHVTKEQRRFTAKPYPPELPGQIYRRTGKLGRSFWYARRRIGEWELGNNAAPDAKPAKVYAAWVMGRALPTRRPKQATIHKDRWYIFEDEAESKLPDLADEMSAELESQMRRVT